MYLHQYHTNLNLVYLRKFHTNLNLVYLHKYHTNLNLVYLHKFHTNLNLVYLHKYHTKFSVLTSVSHQFLSNFYQRLIYKSLLITQQIINCQWREVPTWCNNLFIIINNSTCLGQLYAHLQKDTNLHQCTRLHTGSSEPQSQHLVLNTIRSSIQRIQPILLKMGK